MKKLLNTLLILYRKLILILGHSSFNYSMFKGDHGRYRTTGFYYVYEFPDSKERKYAHCPWWMATHVGGYGICGVIAPIAEISGISWKYRKHHGKYDRLGHNRGLKSDKQKLEFMLKQPKGLTYKQYEDLVLEDAVEAALSGMRQPRKLKV